MNIKEILKMTPENLAKDQHEQLKKAVVEHLEHVAHLIMIEDYSNVEGLLESSPSGDDYGCDNKYIDFSDIYGEDIADVIEKLTHLKASANKKAGK